MRATVCVSLDIADEQDTAALWFEDCGAELVYVSKNYGCGCCVDLFDVDGSEEAIGRLPMALRCSSDWASGDRERRDAGGEMNPYRSRA